MTDAKPLDVMLDIMARRGIAGDDKLALEAAKAAAPYVHGKALSVRRSVDLSRMPDDELELYCRGEKHFAGEGGEASEDEDAGEAG